MWPGRDIISITRQDFAVYESSMDEMPGASRGWFVRRFGGFHGSYQTTQLLYLRHGVELLTGKPKYFSW